MEHSLELKTIIGSDLFSQDKYIKQYLLDPDLPLIAKVKIGLRYYILGDLILQLDELKYHLKSTYPHLFLYVFGKSRTFRK